MIFLFAEDSRHYLIFREADLLMVRGRQHRVRRQGKAYPAPARSKNQGMWGRFSRGSREISGSALRNGVRRVRALNPKGIRMR